MRALSLVARGVLVVGTFAGTVRANLHLGNSSATDDQLWSALRDACAEDFVQRLPEGLDAEVGERGVLLSGGERQRLALARAFLKNAPIRDPAYHVSAGDTITIDVPEAVAAEPTGEDVALVDPDSGELLATMLVTAASGTPR